MPEEKRESLLYVRDVETQAVVTVIELLSPGNKRPGSDGRKKYLAKRQEILGSMSHLVELDLLRGGKRLPTKQPLPGGDYFAIVSRAKRRPRADVFAWTLRQPLPSIPIPLHASDPDVPLDLQHVFAAVYDRVRYDATVDYDADVSPPLGPNEQWARSAIQRWRESKSTLPAPPG
jgi:hypothetical protein